MVKKTRIEYEVFKTANQEPLLGEYVGITVEVGAPVGDKEFGRITILPTKRDSFLFRNSTPELARIIGNLIVEACDIAMKEKF